MVADWRRWFGDQKLPFYFVQLAAWQVPNENPASGGWGGESAMQRRCLEIPYTGMASAIDIGDADAFIQEQSRRGRAARAVGARE